MRWHMEIAQAGATYRTDTPVFLPAAFGLSEIEVVGLKVLEFRGGKFL